MEKETSEMTLLSSDEVQELLALSRGETFTYDTTKTWIDLFKEQVALHPDRPAVVATDGTYTYRELDEASDAVARYLIAKGLQPDTFIAIRMDRSRMFMAAALGAHKASVAYVPIDLDYPAERVEYMMEDSEAALTLDEAAVREAVASCTAGDLRVANPETLAYMIYTSGSTGKPKGVMIQHKALVNYMYCIRKELQLTTESRIACHSNFAFDAAGEDLYPVLTVGGAMYIVPEPARMDIGLLRQYLADNAITGGSFTTQLGQLLGSGEPLDLDYISIGGEKMTSIPNTTGRVLNFYGPTEFTVDSTYFEVDKTRHYDNIPIGRPLYNLMALVLDSKGNLLPKGETGELCMAGPQMAKGYWKRPELTAEKFCEVTIGTEKVKVYRTGDLVRWNDENQLEYLGRIDTQVKLRGFRIELGEIEARAAMFDGISMVAAEVWQGQTLCLYYSATKDIDKASLQAFLAETLTEYMVPTAYMQLDEMPLTPNGKINRKALPAPQIQLEDIVPPENELEQQLFDMVADLLGTSSFGVTNNLVSLGLSSLNMMKLNVVIQSKLGRQISVATIMREPTIRQIANELSQTDTDSDIPQLTAYERRERYPLTENQRGVYIDWEMNRDTTQYNIPDLYRFNEMDAERLAEAVRQTVDAHCYLKTRLVVAEGDVMQERHDDEEAVISIQTLNEEPDTAFFGQRMRPFNLFNDRLYRIEIYQAPQNVYLFTDIHHIIYDGLSSDVFLQSVMDAYEGKPLQPEKVTAYDFALYEQAMKQTPVYEQAQQYFETLTASATVLSVPDSDQPDGKESGILSIPFADEGIQSFCAASGVTVSSFMHAVFAETMSRLTREDNILYLTINNGRSASADLISCVGMFVKTLPVVRPATDKDTTVADFVKAVHQQLQESYENDIYPYTQLVERRKIHAEAMFVYQGGIIEGDSAGSEDISIALDTAKLPIDFSVYPQGDGYKLALEYSGTRYSAEDIKKMGQAFVSTVHNMARGGRLNEVALVSSDEVQELLALSRGETFTYDTTKTWIDLFKEQVALHPDRPAVVATDGTYTYRELDEASDAVARYLIAKGLQPDTFIAIRMDRSRMFMAAALGAHKASVAYVPIDLDYPAERMEYMMEDSEAALTLDEAAVQEAVANCTAGDLRAANPETLAYMIYTSGSTGKPKGVMIQHKALVNYMYCIRKELQLTTESRIVCHSNFAFDAAGEDLYPVLTVGGAMYIVPEPARMDIGLLRQYLTDNAITGGSFTTQLGQLLGSGETLDLDYISIGGEKMTSIPNTTGRVLNFYGPTEFTVDSTYFEVDKTRHYDNIPIGRPLYNLMALVLDSKGNLLPKGETGELCMAGPQIAKGYWKRPELTAEKFCEVTIGTEKVKVYRTGDLVRWNDENQLEYLGRIDTQVKLRGFRIELGEIEARAAMFDGISMVAAEVWQGQTLCLYYSATKDIDKASLQAFLAETLTEYMVPTAYMQLDEMPLTPNGKINRKALPAPQIQLEDIVPPENELEQQLFDIVAELLGTSSFGVTNNLLSLGLTSLGAMRLNVAIQDKLSGQVTVATIMREPTIRQIAGELSQTGTDSDMPQLKAYERRERYPLTENQRGVYIDWELNRDTTQYNIPDLYRFKEMDAERLAEAVRQAVDAHSYMKTRLVVAEGDVMQERHDDEEAVISIQTLNEEPDTAFFGQRMRPFNLFNDRLYRIEIYQAPQNIYLFTDIHHIIYDGLSSDVFIQSVMDAYEGKPLQPEKVTAYDFALYEQAMKQTPVYEQAQQYFETLTASANVLSIPDSDQPDGKESGILSIPFADEGIQSFCAASGVTVSSFMNAVFAETMSRLTREDDILYLTINNGRSASADLISCVGMFVKTLPVVRPATDNDTTVADFVKAVHQQLQDSYENDIYPYTQLVERRKIHAEAIFDYQGGIREDDSEGGEGISADSDTSKLPIDFSVYPQDDGYKLTLEYSGTRYSAADIKKMGQAFVSMAHNMARGGRLNEVALVSSDEVQELLALSRGETFTYDTTKTWIDLFKEQVALHPDRPAVVATDGTYTYRELDEASDAVARYLIAKGLQPDTFIAIRMDRSRLFMAAALGAHKASVAYVPIDLESPAERVEYVMEDSEAALTLDEAAVQEAVASCTAGGLRAASPETLAYMIYTSGSTGKPKGVMIQHKALLNYLYCIRKELRLTAGSRIACHSNFAFDAAVEDLYPVLTVGGAMYIVPEPARMDIGLLRQYLKDNAITGGSYTTQLGQLLGSGEPLDVDYIVLGGEKMTTTPQTTGRVLNTYGPTEFTVDSTYFEVDKTRHYDNIPIGRPLYNLTALVLDSKGNLLPKGQTGELCMAGPQMAKGYWKRPELTAEKFCEVTIGTEKVKVYHTGDLVRWNDENQLEYLGRIDTQVKLRGFRIELGEIEARAAMFDGISMVAAEVWQGQTLCLYYSATKDIDKDALQAFLAETLTEYMVPTAYMQLDEMPLTPNGKINRKVLPEPQIQLEDVVAPENDVEQQLFDIVAELLGTSSFGVTNNLLSLGLTSLGAMRLNVAIQNELSGQVTVATIMREPTIRQIANKLSQTDTDSDIPQLTAYERRERYPLTENQRGVYIDWELNRDTTQYNIPDLYRFKEMDAERLAGAVRQAVDAHCYLKTRLVMAEGDVMQERHDDEEAVISIQTLNKEPDEAFFGQRVRPFNLFNDRLYRIEIYQAPQNVYLFADIHHIIYDGLSSDVFMQSVKDAYEGKPLQPEKVTAYDFALYEQAMKQTPVYEQAQQYFETLTASATVLSVPDSDQPDGKDSGALSIPFADEGIQAFCTVCGVTVSSFMNAVFAETMSRLTREDDMLYLTINNGRSASADLISCVGMFVKTLPVVRPSTDKDTTVADFVKAVHQQLQESYENDIYPYTQLVERRKIHAEAIFDYQGGIREDDSEGGEGISADSDTSKLPIDFSVSPQGDGYKLALEYSGTRYSAEDIKKMGQAFVSMAHNMARGGRLNEVALVSSDEVQELLALSRGETFTYDTTKTWIDLFKEQVALHPDQPAVVDAEGTYTYRELDEASDAVARYLIAKGLQPDTFIAIRMDRSRMFMAAALGAHKASVAYVPIDLDYPAERVDYMMEDSEAALTLDEATVQEAVANCTAGDLRVANPETLAYMIYTSGSTGKPKGVMIQHKALMNFVHFIRKEWYLTAESRIACHSNFAFDAAVEDLYPVLTVGGAMYIVPEPARKDIGLLRQYLTDNAITGGCYTTQLGQLLGSGEPLDVDYIVLGGEKMTTTPQTTGRVLNTYGPTEFTVDSTYFEVDKTRHYDNIPIGRPLYNLMALVLDSKGNLLPKGETGELCMAGPQMAKGYWKRPELTAEKFCEATIGTEKVKVYHTGDLVRWNDENQLEYLGRIDTQVKLRGFRIELGEIEARAAMFDGISMVAAEVWQGQTLCLYYSATKDIDKASLQAFLAETLAGYMVPAAYMQLDEMPLTPNGKINRKALPEPELKSGTDYVAPEGHLEVMFARVFENILKVSPIGANDDFFELGGTSINAIRVVVEASKQGVNIVFNDLFQLKTPRALAAYVKQSQQQSRTIKTETVVLSNEEQKTPDAVSTVTGNPYQDYDDLLQRNTLEAIRKGSRQPIEKVLLAGSTGYLGIHILHELLQTNGGKIFCPVRCDEGEKPMDKLQTLYFYYFDDTDFSILEKRVVAFKAEMSNTDALKNFKGRELTVINCVANVKHFSSGDDIEHVNTDSVRALIDFCLHTNSRLIHISTVSIAGDRVNGVPAKDVVLTEQRFWLGQQVEDNQYVHSKFVAEDLVLDAVKNRGLNAKIMRVGNLSARQADGEFQINFNSNNFMATLRAYVALGEIPFDELDAPEEFSPIDELARAILLLAETPRECVVFHPYNNHTILQVDILEGLARAGLYVKGVERKAFESRLNKAMQNPVLVELLRPLMAYDSAAGVSIEDVDYDCWYTTQVLYRLGFKWRPIDEDYVERFAKALYGLGFFDEQ